MIKALEKHLCKKCNKCPFYWHDGFNSESGCYLDEGYYGDFWRKLSERLHIDYYSGCFIPSFVLKLLRVANDLRLKRKYKYFWKKIVPPKEEKQ